MNWADPGVLWKKAPRAMRAMRGKTLETVPFNRTLAQSTVKLVLPSNESYESKTGCNRTLATVLWVPLMNFSFWLAIRATIYRSLGALRAQNRKKVSKRVFWGSAKKSPKIPEKVKKYPKLDFFGYFLTFSGIFGDFFADPQKDSF